MYCNGPFCTSDADDYCGMFTKCEECPVCGPIMRGAVNVDFGQALKALKLGHKAARKGWNGKGIFIELQRPDEHSKMTHPYIFIDTTGLQTDNPDAPKNRVPWLASQTDMLADDWVVVK